jgi:hypothetical protein
MTRWKTRRPNTWKVKGDIPHAQYECYLQMRAQASFRGDLFLLTFEQYQELWRDRWHLKGRGSNDYCLNRIDPQGPWEVGNVECYTRREHLRRQAVYKQGDL